MSTIRIPESRQGQTGMGQGGFACHQFAEAIGETVTVALRNPLPLDTDLHVVPNEESWHLVDPAHPRQVLLEATPWQPHYATTDAISIADATGARQNFTIADADHPAPDCLSCGIRDRSLRVHAGPLGDGRWATPFRAPAWARTGTSFDQSLLWMAMDCAAGWYISNSGSARRQAVTVQFAVSVHAPIEVEADYALVVWNGDYDPAWDGRKRGATTALFDRGGTCVAQSRSFWVAQV